MNYTKKLDAINSLIRNTEADNRSCAMQSIMEQLAKSCLDLMPGKIQIVENYGDSTCPFALFRNETGDVKCAPLDPLAISFYEYCPSVEEEAARRDKNPLLRQGLTIRGPLDLVDEVIDATQEVSKEQLIAIQTLIGNDSTWWPVTDYSNTELVQVFGGLELNLIVFNEIPIGIAHFDYADLERNKSVKVVFIGIDPEMQGKGLGREILHAVMTQAMDHGAEKIYLDTVSHRDIRTNTSVGPVEPSKPQGTAHDVYLKAGFKLVDVKLIDPANKKQLEDEGLTINQLNGPLEYRFVNLGPLRAAVDDRFGIPESKRQALTELI